MIYTKFSALESLKPLSKYIWYGEDYSGLNWLDTGEAPTESEIDAELLRLNNAEPMVQLRYERNKKIAESDWRANSDVTLSEEWKTYRQSLRDITNGASPKLDSEGKLDMTSVTWPTEPS